MPDRVRSTMQAKVYGMVYIAAASVLFSIAAFVLEPISAVYLLKHMAAQPMLCLLNWVPVLLVLIFFTACFRNCLLAGGVTALLVCGLSLIDRIKVQIRYEPLYSRDLRLFREAFHALGNYSLSLEPKIIILFLLLVAVFLLLGWLLRRKIPLWKLRVRIALGAAALGCLLLLTMTVYRSNGIYGSFETSTIYNHVTFYHELGTVYSFLHSFTSFPVDKPEGYSTAEAKAWDEAGTVQEEGKQVHVILVMNEAFSALTELDAFTYDESGDPLINYHRIQSEDNVLSGKLVVANLGGGTSNTEFDVLTGMQADALSASTSVAFGAVGRNLDSLMRVFSEDNYETSFVHPGESWFYARETTYEKLGAELQVYEEDMTEIQRKGSWVTDAYMADYIENAFEETAASGCMQFSYITTFQNHMTYHADKYGSDVEIPQVETDLDLSEEAEEQLSVYIEGIRDADAMLGALTEYFSQREEPVLLAFFGDHLPSLGTDQSVYSEIGIEIGAESDDAETCFYPYATPYLIWANDACSRELDWDNAISGLGIPENGHISACFLGQIILELTGRGQESSWTAFLGRLRRELPVVHRDTCMTMDGSVTCRLTEEQQMNIDQWRKWTYYKMKQKVIP